MIGRLHKNKNISEKKSISRPPRWFYFTSPGPQETIFYLRVASHADSCIIIIVIIVSQDTGKIHTIGDPGFENMFL